jgi:hypothetical protein
MPSATFFTIRIALSGGPAGVGLRLGDKSPIRRCAQIVTLRPVRDGGLARDWHAD